MIATGIMAYMWALLICTILGFIIVLIRVAIAENSARICMICQQKKEAYEFEPRNSKICNNCVTHMYEKACRTKDSSNSSQI